MLVQSNAPFSSTGSSDPLYISAMDKYVTHEAMPNGQSNRINSGFYSVRASPTAVAAFRAIVEDARTSRTSEQPSFDRVLCNSSVPGARRAGSCVYTSAVGEFHVQILSRITA